MKKFVLHSPKEINKKLFCIFALLIISLLSLNIAIAEDDTSSSNWHGSWVNKNTGYGDTGCYVNVKNKTTNKWSSGIYQRYWADNVNWTTGVTIGDELYIDAYTCFTNGKLWIYEDGICVKTIDAGQYQDHIYLNWTVKTTNLRIACSAAIYAQYGEQLSVNITAAGDNKPPKLTLSPKYLDLNDGTKYLTLTITDNVGATGYYISTSSTTPNPDDENWYNIIPSVDTEQTYRPTQSGVYYVFAKDGVNNISDYASFEAGRSPRVPQPLAIAVREGEEATFIGAPSGGTAPYTYQWYKNNAHIPATEVANAISNATSDTLRFIAKEEDDKKYYYVKVSNRFGSTVTTPTQLLVYYPHILGSLTNKNLKKNQVDQLTVTFTKNGNTDIYTYQWYKARNETAPGTRIVGAIENKYTLAPRENSTEWYYCEVTNVSLTGTPLYTKTTNRAKVVADVTEPVITITSISPRDVEHINSEARLDVYFRVTDTGQGYTEEGDNFTGSDIKVLVNGSVQNATCNLSYTGHVGNDYNYTLALTGVTGNGELTLKIPAGSIKDNFENENTETTFNTGIQIDNIRPAIKFESIESGINEIYLNREKTITMKLSITDSVGLDVTEFSENDITVRIGGATANSGHTKTLRYDSKSDDKYFYTLTVANLEGDGVLALFIPSGKILDYAGNTNEETVLEIKHNGGDIIIDNTPPVINSIITELNRYGSGVIYPTSLASWHEDWSNQNIYVTINAQDTNAIDYYASSYSQGASFTVLSENRETLKSEFAGNMYYRAYDKAGNYSEKAVPIKIDKTMPIETPIAIYELRDGGAEYVYQDDKPSNKTLYVRALTPNDKGNVKSGIETGNAEDATDALEIDGQRIPTYYTIVRYRTISKGEVLNTWRQKIDEGPVVLIEDGYYEVVSTTTDNAGNVVKSAIYPINISKRADNTISVSNILDIGSGVKTLTIDVFKGNGSDLVKDSYGIANATNTNNMTKKAIDTIVVEKPYKDYTTTVRLGRGRFYVQVYLEDNVGIKTVYHKAIYNDF